MIGIICAMQLEAEGIIARSQNTKSEKIAGMFFTEGTLMGKKISVVVCGVGKVNAAMCAVVMIEKYHPEFVINIGVAGSLSKSATIGDIVVATKTVQHDMNTTALGDKRGEVSFPEGAKMYFDCGKSLVDGLSAACEKLENTRVLRGVVASGDIFVSDRKKRMKIADTFDAVACEMEGAAIGHVCSSLETPYGVIRAISDDLDENKGVDFVRFSRLASEKNVAALCEFLKN